jgi:MoaD family protein
MTHPRVTLKFYASLRAKAGRDEVVCEAEKVRDALRFLKTEYSAEFNRVLKSCHIYLNQDNISFLQGVNTRLKDGDVLNLLPPTGGG